jgi:hypothetical protein
MNLLTGQKFYKIMFHLPYRTADSEFDQCVIKNNFSNVYIDESIISSDINRCDNIFYVYCRSDEIFKEAIVIHKKYNDFSNKYRVTSLVFHFNGTDDESQEINYPSAKIQRTQPWIYNEDNIDNDSDSLDSNISISVSNDDILPIVEPVQGVEVPIQQQIVVEEVIVEPEWYY